MNLLTPISELTGVGKKTAPLLKRIGLATVRDLLWYFPFRYEDFRSIVPISQLVEGTSVTIQGHIELIANKKSFRGRTTLTEALITDATGTLRIVWFNQSFLIKNLHPGDEIYLSGTVKRDMLGVTIASPQYEKIRRGVMPTNTARLVPIYPATDRLTQKQLRFLLQEVLPLTSGIVDWLPEAVRHSEQLSTLGAALRGIHFPTDEKELAASTRRLKFDELFLLQLQAERSRSEQGELRAPSLVFQEAAIKSLVGELPFVLTPTQKIAAWEILKDIAKTRPMNRLLSGDVGSGKTVVAALALYNATLNDYQAVLMAPTEILATQHYHSLVNLLGNKITIALLTHSQFLISNFQFPISIQSAKKQKQELVTRIKSGEIKIIIGTHALLSEGVDFAKLGLVVVDEQHRFGVAQRQLLKNKGASVHFLSMTATPIPRSLGLFLYGDLDLSMIPELPPNRKKIITRLVEPAWRDQAYQFIREQVREGRQVFVVCPLIDIKEQGTKSKESAVNIPRAPLKGGIDKSPLEGGSWGMLGAAGRSQTQDKKSVLQEYAKLSKEIFPDLRVGYLHGKLKSKEKEQIMSDFSAQGGSALGGKNNHIDILVSTSVVEVGVDIPNASVMMIEGAENFGLAQLHQFRGRVGRSIHQSYCLLFTGQTGAKINERLSFFAHTENGFKLAEKDLEIRGPGEVYGTEQSGLRELRLATLRDTSLIKTARTVAERVAPLLSRYPLLVKKLAEWGKVVHLE